MVRKARERNIPMHMKWNMFSFFGLDSASSPFRLLFMKLWYPQDMVAFTLFRSSELGVSIYCSIQHELFKIIPLLTHWLITFLNQPQKSFNSQ